MSTKRRDHQRKDDGFILPLVMIISLIIATGLMALAARSWLGLSGTIRQSQSRQAREIAEAALWLCSPHSGSVNGQEIKIAGGQVAG